MATVKDFSVEEKLTAVLTLQKIDSKIDEIKTLKGELPMEVKDLEDEIEGLQTRIQNIDAEINSINNFVEQKSNAKKEAQALIKKYEKQQDNVKNNREFEAINKEMELQELEVKLNDKHIKDAAIEQKEREVQRNRTQDKITDLEDALKAKKAELEKIIGETEKEEKALSAKSDEAKEKVDPRLLSAYERIRSSYRNGLAVVPILRDSCGGCFNVIPPQRQSEIRQHKKIIVCEHCGRILVDNDLNDAINVGK
ncbi:zinc ribbon domain-containing protein [Polluticoccus soli]|uniref:zinc ribbon domain-containing protein n=1 Tax=Polluticoccus soli TaxID=3034150 RepID=UPI0023E0E5EC|nr:C4-type zinc ribbon domain-containing protein [Flavipsychrobacter sp. JY13-12]